MSLSSQSLLCYFYQGHYHFYLNCNKGMEIFGVIVKMIFLSSFWNEIYKEIQY